MGRGGQTGFQHSTHNALFGYLSVRERVCMRVDWFRDLKHTQNPHFLKQSRCACLDGARLLLHVPIQSVCVCVCVCILVLVHLSACPGLWEGVTHRLLPAATANSFRGPAERCAPPAELRLLVTTLFNISLLLTARSPHTHTHTQLTHSCTGTPALTHTNHTWKTCENFYSHIHMHTHAHTQIPISKYE